jgi:aminopeptidase N
MKGLVTYHRGLLLFDEKEANTHVKTYILTTIAHEFTHQWTGNQVG